jgi:hypothetical protein
LASLLFAEVYSRRVTSGARQGKVLAKRCFVVELLKNPETRSGFGRWGAAMFGGLAAKLDEAGVPDIDLITRFQHDSKGRKGSQTWKAGDDYSSTADARTLFEELTFKSVWEHRIGEDEPDDDDRPSTVLHGVHPGQCYMTAKTTDVIAAAAKYHLKAGRK